MAARRRTLTNPLELAVLATLRDAPMHPYEIARLLKHRGKDQSIKIRFGSLYTVVRRLEESGWITPAATGRAGNRPERTVYRLTDDGLAELEARMRELVSRPEKEYPRFEAALSLLGVLAPDEVAQLLAERLARLDVEIAGERAALAEVVGNQGLPRLFLVETEYALAMKAAEAAWCRGLLAELTDGTLPGVDHWRRWHKTGEFPAEWRDTSWARTDARIRGEAPPPE